MLQKLYDRIRKNLSNHESIDGLTYLWNQLIQLVKNNYFVFVYHMNNPQLCKPTKNSSDVRTHNYYLKNFDMTYRDNVTFFINCDVLFNNAVDDYTDMSIISGGANINFKLKNDVENLSHSYRITACGFIATAKTSTHKLQYLDNKSFIGIDTFSNNKIRSYFNGKYDTFDVPQDLFQDMEDGPKAIFDKPLLEFYKAGHVPEKSWYLIVHTEECKMFQFFKHIEHVPKMEYEQILTSNINENVWA